MGGKDRKKRKVRKKEKKKGWMEGKGKERKKERKNKEPICTFTLLHLLVIIDVLTGFNGAPNVAQAISAAAATVVTPVSAGAVNKCCFPHVNGASVLMLPVLYWDLVERQSTEGPSRHG